MPTATFLQGTKIALEVDRSTAPSTTSTRTNGPGGPWWAGGGKWFDVVTEGLPGVQEKQAVIFPKGHAGQRPSNQQVPVVGRKWSEGGLAAPVLSDFLGALLLGALGGVSTNMIPSTAPSLMAANPVKTNPKSFVLGTQPDAGGNILRFELSLQGVAGTVSISGINSDGFGASELISFASTGLFYSRTSWSSIGASGIAVSGMTDGSISIFGIKRFEHLFFTASSAPTFSIERIATPVAGGPASRSKMHVGMIMKQLTLNTPADDDAGIFNCSTEFEGDPAATCTTASNNSTSLLKIWPAWTLKITRDGGTAWNLAKKFTLNINSANRNYKTAAGTQHPQGKFEGSQEITGNIDIQLENEVEYNRWQGASVLSAYARWKTDWRLNPTASQNYELGASLNLYFENLTEAEDEEAFALTGDFRTVVDANWGPGQFILINGTPGTAYGNAVV